MNKYSTCCETKDILKKNICCNDEFRITDQSQVANPKIPKKIISNEFLKKIEDISKILSIDDIGYAQIDDSIMNENQQLKFPNAILLTMEINKEIISEVPSEYSQELNNILYDKFGKITYILSDYLRTSGFSTQVAHPKEELLDLTSIGIKSGIGYIGNNGLLISPKNGPALKVSALLTSIENLPISDTNEHLWIEEYCKICGKCTKGCPEDALISEKDNKNKLIDSRCIGCNLGCTYCIESCPFYYNGYEWVKKKFNKIRERRK